MPSITPQARQIPQRCYLLELPPELRLIIYDLLFQPMYFTVHVAREVRCYGSVNLSHRGSVRLLQTCRQLCNEATPIVHKSYSPSVMCWDVNTDLTSSDGDPIDGPGFFESLKHIRNVSIDVQCKQAGEGEEDGTGESVAGVVKCIATVLEALDYGRSLQMMDLMFWLNDGAKDEPTELAMLRVFRKVKCSGAVTIELRRKVQNKVMAEEYLELAHSLNA